MSTRDLVIPAPPLATVAVAGTDQKFPVRRIYCVGRNYLEHIREMKGDERAPPFFFQKPTDAVVANGAVVPYPSKTSDCQHEIELVLAIGKGGRNIAETDAAAHVYGVALGIDLTRRDLQIKARDVGRPWEAGKAFDHSAPMTAIEPLAGKALPTSGAIGLSVNGVTKQTGDLSEMIWNSAEVIAHLSGLFELQPGDLIMTGTPAGVGKVIPGDKIEAWMDGVERLTVTIGPSL